MRVISGFCMLSFLFFSRAKACEQDQHTPEESFSELGRSTAEMKLLLFWVLVFRRMADGQIPRYFFVNKPMNWTDAQSYCRQTYTDLATITSDGENQSAMKSRSGWYFSWIGLNESVQNSWAWSDGEDLNYSQWANGEPAENSKNGDCAFIGLFGWYTMSCSVQFPFICQWRINLVTESMTWDKAMKYCKKQYRVLAFLTDETKNLLAEINTVQAESVSVWFGLCFLDGNWLWANGKPASIQAFPPSCPVPRYRCGAYNTRTGTWENRDCSKKLNLICFWRWVNTHPHSHYSRSDKEGKNIRAMMEFLSNFCLQTGDCRQAGTSG